MNDLISIITPVYNAAAYLTEFVESVLMQTYINFELILINDGSKDESGKICNDFSRCDSRIRVFHQENRGVSVARNVGLDHATGKWLFFADADDIMLPAALEKLYNATLGKDVDIVKGSTKVMVNEKIIPLYYYNYELKRFPLLSMDNPALWGYMFKASVVKENNIYFVPGLAYSEDKVFMTEIAINSESVVSISDFVYIYRRNEGSACFNKDGIMTSRHYFRAAAAIQKMTMNITKKEHKEILLKMVRNLQNVGCYEYVAGSFSLKTYSKFERQYLVFFDNRWNLLYHTICAWLKFKRRQIITFRDDPLSGKEGLISLLKVECHNLFRGFYED